MIKNPHPVGNGAPLVPAGYAVPGLDFRKWLGLGISAALILATFWAGVCYYGAMKAAYRMRKGAPVSSIKTFDRVMTRADENLLTIFTPSAQKELETIYDRD